MRKRALLISLVFAVVGGGAAFVALAQATHSRPSSAETGSTVVRVLVPARSIEVGATLAATDVQLTPILKTMAPPDAITDVSDVQGKFATISLVAGQPIRRDNVSDTPPGSRLAAMIPEGAVAVTVAVSDVISTGGFITPGDHVDVLGVVTKEATDDAQVVLRDVLVLAVSNALNADQAQSSDPKATASPGSRNPQGLDSTITVAVTIQEAQRLVQVDEVGKLRFALTRRNPGVAFSQR